MGELSSSEAIEEGSVKDRIEEMVTIVQGGQRFGHIRGMRCGFIPTPLSSSQAHSFTQSDNHDKCSKKDTLQATIDQTKKLQAIVDFFMLRIGGSGGRLIGGESSQANI